MRKIYIIPNLVTTANLYCGFSSITASIHHEYVIAGWFILAAGIFDMLDGRIARMAKATSQFGVEYDSLSDLVSFGLAPAILLYQWGLEPFGRLGLIASFLYVCCAALRLARFNVNTAVVSKAYFQGVASPIAAGSIATFIIFSGATGLPESENARQVIAFIQALALASLMVCTIPFPSFKELNWRARSSFGYLMIAVMLLVFIAIRPEITLFLIFTTYLLASLIWNAYRLATGKPSVVKPLVVKDQATS
ncbi:MAG: CDP-diacylglycerol--serine O-phosphatidyltransferase [Cryobacterium sp.]|nr:CDP-diacylglycerol--serine O-phosphatidyltransferase [Oligoflexia bacterium]